MARTDLWTREQMILVLNLYMKLPFGKMDARNPGLNPENGICLSSLYDKAFDKGLISFTNDLHVIFSIRLNENVGKDYYAKYFEPIENATLVTPKKYHINPQFLEWHRDCIFNKS